jgi:hypothetical protein
LKLKKEMEANQTDKGQKYKSIAQSVEKGMKEVNTVYKYQLISPENLRPRVNADICKEVEEIVKGMQLEKKVGAKKYNSP